jgi:hypothetical protein
MWAYNMLTSKSEQDLPTSVAVFRYMVGEKVGVFNSSALAKVSKSCSLRSEHIMLPLIAMSGQKRKRAKRSNIILNNSEMDRCRIVSRAFSWINWNTKTESFDTRGRKFARMVSSYTHIYLK